MLGLKRCVFGVSSWERIAMAKSPPVKKKSRTPTVYCIPTTLWSSVILK